VVITLKDGTILKGSFPGFVHGYVASKIEIEADDILRMRLMARQAPEDFNVAMLQLEYRFDCRRNPPATGG